MAADDDSAGKPGIVEVDLQVADESVPLPDPDLLARLLRDTLSGRMAGIVTLRIVGEPESADLNRQYRHRDGPTNVLSFSAIDWPVAAGETPQIGDIVVCGPVVAREAREQGKAPAAHWAHIAVHGALHLIGYDHEDATEAAAMEAEERRILSAYGFPDPYLEA